MTTPDYRALARSLSLDQKVRLTGGMDGQRSCDEPAIGLRSFRMVDGPSAVNAADESLGQPALGPCPTGLGATWDHRVAASIGDLQGWEARRRGVSLILGPNINLERSPLAGRAFEYFSEDPFLAGALASAWITGVQGRGVGAVAKHLVCNDSETQRQRMNSVVDERALHEVYLLPFEMAVQAGVWAIMTAYNRTNGFRNAEQPLINAVVKGLWGFDGLVLSDWHGAHDAEASIAAGLDFEMPGPPKAYGAKLADAVRAGRAQESAVDEAVCRLLRLGHRLGALGEPVQPPDLADPDVAEVLTQATASSFVLLRNQEAALPLNMASLQRIAVLGPNADEPAYQGGTLGQIALSPDIVSPLGALRQTFGDDKVTYAPGVLAAPRLPAISKLDIRPAPDHLQRGITVDYFPGRDASGAPAASEVRDRGSLLWFGAMPGVGPLSNDATVRLSFVLTPDTTGRHLLRTGGSGDVRLWVDGVLAGEKDKPLGEDTMGDLLWPQLLDAELDLEGGRPYRVVVEMYSDSVRARSLHVACRAPEPAGLMDAAVAAAAQADVAIVVVGETTDNAMESVDRGSTRLPGAQAALIERVCAANPRTIVVVNTGHVVDMPWAERAAAVLMAWFPGQQFGPALADVLAGRREPGGRLPLTIARSEADYPAFDLTPVAGDLTYRESTLVGGRWLEAEGVAAHYPLGHGLGYAAFAFEPAALQAAADGLTAIVTVRNISERAGKAVVQAYVRALDDPGNPASELKGFAAVTIAGGGQAEIRIALPARAFSHWDTDAADWRVSPGRFAIRIGRSLHDITSETVVTLDAGGKVFG